jgi:large subunit ribosomal protein L29
MTQQASELRSLDGAELVSRLADAKQELFNLRFQVVTGRLDNTSRIQHVRREVARLMTIQRERELAAARQMETN